MSELAAAVVGLAVGLAAAWWFRGVYASRVAGMVYTSVVLAARDTGDVEVMRATDRVVGRSMDMLCDDAEFVRVRELMEGGGL